MRASLFLISFIACGPRGVAGRVDNEPHQAYVEQRQTAIGTSTDGDNVSVTSSDGNGCIEVVDGQCIKPVRSGSYCSDNTSGPVDVIAVDGVSKVTVCYPSPGEGKNPVLVTDPAEALAVAKTANGSAITFSEATNGKPIVGPVTLSANNVSLFGNGPTNTIIDGDLIIEKNGAKIRGVRIKGNLIIAFNDASIVLTQVDGNIVSEKNNGLFASNVVYGNMTLSGNNNQLYYNQVAGTLSAAKGSTCAHNAVLSDPNGNKIVDSGEVGAELTCPK